MRDGTDAHQRASLRVGGRDRHRPKGHVGDRLRLLFKTVNRAHFDARIIEAERTTAFRTADQGAGDASGLPFSMTKVSTSLLPVTEQPSWIVSGDVSNESPALRVWSGFPSILSTKSPCMT